MQTDEWGSHEWKSMHFKAFGSPEVFTPEISERYAKFFKINVQVLSCSMCQKAFGHMMSFIIIEEYLDSRDGLVFWLFMMHNLVNRKLKKPLAILSHVIYEYETKRARCGNKNNKEKYDQCKASLSPYTMDQANASAKRIKNKYRNIAFQHMKSYYNSEYVLDPKYHKCEL